MNHPLVYIIIVNWNQKELTDECLKSLSKVNYGSYKIVLVDNGSEDGSGEYLRKVHPEVKCIMNKENLGFSGGNNVGINYAISKGCDYVYLLNNDTEVDPDFLSEIVEVVENDPTIGIAGSTVFYYKPSDIIWYAGGHANWISGDMVDPRVGQKLKTGKLEIEDVDEVAGAGMLIRSKSIEKVGVLNTKFFIYFEETDWCQRVKKAGWRVVWAPKSKIWHKVSMAFGELSPVMIYLMTRNRWLFMRMHSPYFALFIIHYILRSLKYFLRYWRKKQSNYKLAIYLGVKDALLNRYGKGELERLRKNNFQ